MNNGFTFQKAERKKVKLKIGITGPSGSGKSYSALRLARGIAGKAGRVALINTERNRGEIYATEFEYDMLDLVPPFSPERFIQALDAALAGGYDVVIIDSASHEWIGEGGILHMADKMQGNSFANWAKLTPRHDAFIDRITSSDVHVIVCMRGKDEYVLEEDEKGKQVPRKIGLGSRQRDGFEYEFHVAFNLDMQHTATVAKDNSHLFDGTYKMLTEEDGVALIAWATSGRDVPPPSRPSAPDAAGSAGKPSGHGKRTDVPEENKAVYLEMNESLKAMYDQKSITSAQVKEIRAAMNEYLMDLPKLRGYGIDAGLLAPEESAGQADLFEDDVPFEIGEGGAEQAGEEVVF